MKKKLLILTSTLGLIAILTFILAGNKDGSSSIDSKLLVMEKFAEDDYQKILTETLKKDEVLSKFLKESRSTISDSKDAALELENLIEGLTNYYEIAHKKVENIQDETLKAKVTEALKRSEADFQTKRNSADNSKKSVEELIAQLEDLNTAISILATIPTQQINENEIQERVNTLDEKKTDLKSKIKSAEEEL